MFGGRPNRDERESSSRAPPSFKIFDAARKGNEDIHQFGLTHNLEVTAAKSPQERKEEKVGRVVHGDRSRRPF